MRPGQEFNTNQDCTNSTIRCRGEFISGISLIWNTWKISRATSNRLNFSFLKKIVDARRRHWLAGLLIFGITLGSTVEAIHNHRGPKSNSELHSCVTEDSNSWTSSALNENDCAICHLQRNLSSSIVLGSVRIFLKETGSTSYEPGAKSYFSTRARVSRNRGPPFSTQKNILKP